jgi:MFS family permease
VVPCAHERQLQWPLDHNPDIHAVAWWAGQGGGDGSIFLSNLAVTLGAVFWGKLIDAMHWHKTVVDICSAAVAITAASIFFISSTPLLMLTSALVGFFSVGPAPVTNLLVMEKSRREDWLKT